MSLGINRILAQLGCVFSENNLRRLFLSPTRDIVNGNRIVLFLTFIMADVKEIISIMAEHDSADEELIKKAYSFAEKAHEGQKRFSGEPYFNHCFETAKILAELRMGATSIAAGLLHDTLEDAGVQSSAMENDFGREILFLVDGVT